MPTPGLRCPFCSSRNTFQFSNYVRCKDCGEKAELTPTWDIFHWPEVNLPSNPIIKIFKEIFSYLGIILVLIGLPTIFYLRFHYVWEIPFIGPAIHTYVYGEPNHPDWVLEYTEDPKVVYNISWHTDSLQPCKQAPPGTHIVFTPGIDRAEGLYLEDTAICTQNPSDQLTPSCTALHELAHAVDFAQRGYTPHDEHFYWLMRSLYIKPATQAKYNLYCEDNRFKDQPRQEFQIIPLHETPILPPGLYRRK